MAIVPSHNNSIVDSFIPISLKIKLLYGVYYSDTMFFNLH